MNKKSCNEHDKSIVCVVNYMKGSKIYILYIRTIPICNQMMEVNVLQGGAHNNYNYLHRHVKYVYENFHQKCDISDVTETKMTFCNMSVWCR